ncbi:hypothetical protein E1A91_A10G086900v1 [Gossypium mustelinum]|uniref:Uncharacterized protein n=1 Tax=Gossypium mustelinum TaxID=34275 RepID=A0A5D2XJ29_GOSMU|nr:hypothetical protein E1A91_A10G086900v1 [Gossypium mustelinum]
MGALNLDEVKVSSGTPLLNHHYLVWGDFTYFPLVLLQT